MEYATVVVSLEEAAKENGEAPVSSLWSQMTQAFSGSVARMARWGKVTLVGAAGAVPFAAVAALYGTAWVVFRSLRSRARS